MLAHARVLRLAVGLICGLAAAAVAAPAGPPADRRLITGEPNVVRHGGAPAGDRLTADVVDTVFVLGGPGAFDGKFENSFGAPEWHGWTHRDNTANDEVFWHVSPFMAPAGQYAMWCGDVFDGDPGYANDWTQDLVFTHQAPDNQQSCQVRWTATLRVDTEPGYDHVYAQVARGDVWETVGEWNGAQLVSLDETITFFPTDYTGAGQDEIRLRVRVDTDAMWSDGDGLWDTDGACQVDDVTVTVDGAVIDSEDFEDQTSQRWIGEAAPGVGDFAGLWVSLMDLDDCQSNYTTQVAFIDDGAVVPGTGGTVCITWCYGPGGYIVNNTGGLAGPGYRLDNSLLSPVMAWPAGQDGAALSFDAYVHEVLDGVMPGILYGWSVRSTDTGDPADIARQPWRGRGFLYYGGPRYQRHDEPIGDLLVPGATHVQVQMQVLEHPWNSPWASDGTPAPYFDNVRVTAWASAGPQLTAREADLLHDGFPAAGVIDVDHLASNSVRLDMARDISPVGDAVVDPGDSVVFTAVTTRDGAVLNGPPRVHVRLKANRVFREVRSLPAGFSLVPAGVHDADLVVGVMDAGPVLINGVPVQDRWQFDLPDTGFFYPGDVLHYFLEATDMVAGDMGTTLLPADTAGFASFAAGDLTGRYDHRFTARALPSLRSDGYAGDHPKLLVWADHGDDDLLDTWIGMMESLNFGEGRHFDIYRTVSPSSRLGNGLGGRATAAVLDGYAAILYDGGDVAPGGNDEDSDDVTLLDQWLQLGDNNLLLAGDNVVSSLAQDVGGPAFLDRWVGVQLVDGDIRQYIGGQTAPTVRAIGGNGVLDADDEWVAYGGCLNINDFDAFTVTTADRLAEFCDPAGNDGVYPYAAAAWMRDGPATNADVILLGQSMDFVFTSPTWTPPSGWYLPVRNWLLDEIIGLFGLYIPPPPGVDAGEVLNVSHHPNPFNPATTVRLDLPRESEVRIRIYDIRGALVRTLADQRLAAGRHEIPWRGDDDRGAPLASGVYFSEVRAGGHVSVHKLALVK
jgi:hypothetical protein